MPGSLPSVAFSSWEVSSWEVWAEEASGLGEKIWLLQPVPESEPKKPWLFKPVPTEGGLTRGEDWAEKAVAHLAEAVGIPCARVEMAEYNGRLGAISANLRPDSHALHHGQEYMRAQGVPGYVPGYEVGRPGHSLENIRNVLDGALPPPNCELPFEGTAFDVFAGYLLLDAWVANRDRHDENWSVLVPLTSEGQIHLCGAYDQANSLGYNVPDMQRERLLAEGRVEAWCQKGTAHRFEYTPGQPIPTLVETAVRALQLASLAAWEYWPERLRQIRPEVWQQVVNRVPRMSDPARSFALSVLEVNRRRVLDACM